MYEFEPNNRKKKWLIALACAVLLVCAVLIWMFAPPRRFPSSTILDVSEGVSLHALARNLREENVVRSPFWFRFFAIAMGGERDMKAGQYYLPGPENTFRVAWRIFHGEYGIETVRTTIPEGFTAARIATLFDERFELFDAESFLVAAEEGYLFPDTYFIPVTATASSTIRIFRDNFARRTAPLRSEIEASDRTFEELITMASILEGEARGEEDMKIVSGILWKRMEIGMPLQVDATFVYFLGKATKDLTLDDLKIDSPYNTYLYRGLPPTPISNPGLASIRSALDPADTEYLYFLTGDDGNMYYSRTHDEHVALKARHIRNGR